MFDRLLISLYSNLTKEDLLNWLIPLIEESFERLKLKMEDLTKTLFLLNTYKIEQFPISIARKNALMMHQKARETKDLQLRLAYRVLGQALSVIHVKNHAFHAANYILKI